MLFVKCLIMCALFWFVQSRPTIYSKVPKIIPSSLGSTEAMDSSNDYIERMSDIFNLSLDNEQHGNLENCENVICMPHYLCINDNVVTNGTELLEWRIALRPTLRSNAEMLVCDYMEMPCCADEAIELDRNDQIDNPIEKSKDNDYDNEDNDETFNFQKCGIRKRPTIDSRIIKGDDALPNEFPWMVGIFYRNSSTDDLIYLGGGSLIHESVILTASHLILKVQPEQLVIRAGEHDILDTKPNKKRQEQFVLNIIKHEELYAPSLINDIALIVLEKPFKLTEAVNMICLPPQNIEPNDNTMCTTSGWGRNAANRHGEYQATPKKINLPIVGRQACKEVLRKTRLGPFYNIDKSLMCAGGKNGGKDTCKGDGGSPLFCPISYDHNRFYQSGIVAGGVGCGEKKNPGMYVNVAHFINWISQQFQNIRMKLRSENMLKQL